MSFDYGVKESNDQEVARLKAEGRTAYLAGKSDFGAGGYKPGDPSRAHYWLIGYQEAKQEKEEGR